MILWLLWAFSAINSVLPPIVSGDAGKVLAVNSGEDGTEWADRTKITAYTWNGVSNIPAIKTAVKNMKVGDEISFYNLGINTDRTKNRIWVGYFKVISIDSSSDVIRFGGNCTFFNKDGVSKIVQFAMYTISSETLRIGYYDTFSSIANIDMNMNSLLAVEKVTVYYYNHTLPANN